MIIIYQVFMVQLLSGLCGGFSWLGFSSYTTTRKPRTAKSDHSVVYNNPVSEVFGYQSFGYGFSSYTTTRKPRTAKPDRAVLYESPVAEVFGYQSFGYQPHRPSQQFYTTKSFHQGYTTTKPEYITKRSTMEPKLTSKKPDSPSQYQSHSESAAYTRQPTYVTTPKSTTTRGSYEVTIRPTVYTRQPVTETSTRPTSSKDSYEIPTRPPAYHWQPAYVTTTRPAPYRKQPAYVTTTRGTTTRSAVYTRQAVTDTSISTGSGFFEVSSKATAYPWQPAYVPNTRLEAYTKIPAYVTTTVPAAYMRHPVTETITTTPTTSSGSYEVTTRPIAYPWQSAYLTSKMPADDARQPVTETETTTSSTTSKGSYEVTSRPNAPQYEPVTEEPKPSLPGFGPLAGSSTHGTNQAEAIEQVYNTEETESNPSSPQVSTGSQGGSAPPLSESKMDYQPLPSFEYYNPGLSLAGYKPSFMWRSFPETDPSPQFCHTEEKVEFVEQCEPYMEETCFTLNKEECSSQVLSDCRPVLKTRVEEVCLNVTNKVCTLVESEERVQEEEVVFLSRCSRVMEQVCDQSYKVDVVDKEQEFCVDMEAVNCTQESIIVSDTVCVEFSCCDNISEEHCQSFPREVTVTSCQPTSILCHNVTIQQAVPIMTEVCRDQPTIVCKVVEDVKPVERKVYTYSMSCDMKVKEECKLVENMKLETSCTEKKSPVCEHNLGEEECNKEDKEFCHLVKMVEEVEVCDDEWQTYEI